MDELIVQMKTISPVWTAGLDRESKIPREIGLTGSLRWWYEVLVRGLGGFACDPTADDRCAFDDASYKTGGVNAGLGTVCAACRLFGCGGWASKFRLLILDAEGRTQVSLDKQNVDFQLCFLPNKPFLPTDLWLLHKTFTLIDQYGSMGGKTTLKPPKQPDYGQVRVTKNVPLPENVTRNEVATWLRELTNNSDSFKQRARSQSAEIPRLDLFFFKSGQWLDTQQMNELVKCDRSGFMAGQRGISKKLFSFQSTKRIWGYAKDKVMLDTVLKTMERMNIDGIKTGQEVIHGL